MHVVLLIYDYLMGLSFSLKLRSKFCNTENAAVVPAFVLALMSLIRSLIPSRQRMMDHARKLRRVPLERESWAAAPKFFDPFCRERIRLVERGRLVRHVHVRLPVTLIYSRGPFYRAGIPVRRRLYSTKMYH